MKRQGAPGEFRSNLHQGGFAQAIELSPEQEAIAVKAAQAMGLGVAGVDLLPSANGLLVMEVNSSPGLEGIQKSTSIDVAGKIIEYIENQARVLPKEK